jgi:hypothetical protein
MTVNPAVYHALADHLPRLAGLRAARPGAAA